MLPNRVWSLDWTLYLGRRATLHLRSAACRELPITVSRLEQGQQQPDITRTVNFLARSDIDCFDLIPPSQFSRSLFAFQISDKPSTADWRARSTIINRPTMQAKTTDTAVNDDIQTFTAPTFKCEQRASGRM